MTKKKCGKIAIIGQPNVGKSTLLNFILGQKLSITSRKAQTTRNQILGIHSEKNIQFIFVDTPGYQQKFLNQMNKRMNKSVTSVFHDVDVVIFMSEPKTLNEIEIELVKMIPNDTPVVNLINKIDRVKNKNKILELININSELQIFKKIIPASIKLKDNQKIILQEIAEFLPVQDFIFDVDDITDKNERFLAAEIIREKIFRLTGDELPYSVAVEIENFEHKDNLRRIFGTILVDKDSQKPVVIGKDGEKLKRISTESRRDMEKLFQSKIWLEIWVKVQKNWYDDARALKSLGI
ncbi:GTPase Era [Methylophilales bacterium MBRSG12]|uniref:GTPase Era n=1 Tax=Methylophilales bacterium MBRS-H7 TaxID=1623450 RepID=A0A0H4J0W1_9PROT|nr:GTPase Era [Methylophilales bacterium MBRSF5]AKO65408.1 GTPase Era [Methylophilales bacterium MBRS-H7]AKO66727.1 GTPase Era [Methylophilales bacterium MBRSG12]